MHARLERTFDLSGVAEGAPVRLAWRTWYEIEEGWDQGYVMATVDGERWTVLPTDRARTASDGGAVGPHVAGATNGWEADGVDLSAYAGGPVTVSFELVTDDAVSLGGWALDALALDALGWSDDVESGAADGDPGRDDARDGGWRAAGWHRAPERLPQRWGLQAIVDDGARVAVTRFPVGADGRAAIVLDDVPPNGTVTVSVSGLTPLVRRAAAYALGGGSDASSSGSTSSGPTSEDAYPPPAPSTRSSAAYPPPSSPAGSPGATAPSSSAPASPSASP